MLRRLWCLPSLAALAFALSGFSPVALAQSPAEPAWSGAQLTLDDVVRQVLEANPALNRSNDLVAAQQAHVAQTGVLPDPSVTVSWMGDPVPFKVMDGDPSSYRGVSVMQMFPLGGKRALQRAVARRDVRVEEAARTVAQRSLIADAKAAFYDYRYYDLAIQITARNKQRLQQLADISESRYRVGKSVQQDVLRARLEVSMLLQKTATLKQQRLTSMARLNTLMGRAAGAPLPPAAPTAPATLPSLESLLPLVEANDAMLARESSMAARERAALALSRKDFTPDLNVGYMFQQRDGMPDMHGMQFTVNLPVHRERLHQEIAEGTLRVRAAEKSQQARRLEAAYELRQAYASAETARQLIDLYDKAILPQAELARDSAQSSYVVGNADFLTVVSGYTSIYSYELDYERQQADYQTALARIEALTGTLAVGPGAVNNAVPDSASLPVPAPSPDATSTTPAVEPHSAHSSPEAH